MNKLNAAPFLGNILIESRIDVTSLIGDVNRQLSTLLSLVPGTLIDTKVTRSFTL